MQDLKRAQAAEHRARRERIATAVIGSFTIMCENYWEREAHETKAQMLARESVEIADALIALLDKQS